MRHGARSAYLRPHTSSPLPVSLPQLVQHGFVRTRYNQFMIKRLASSIPTGLRQSKTLLGQIAGTVMVRHAFTVYFFIATLSSSNHLL